VFLVDIIHSIGDKNEKKLKILHCKEYGQGDPDFYPRPEKEFALYANSSFFERCSLALIMALIIRRVYV